MIDKSDVGGVVLDLRSPEAVQTAFEEMLLRVRTLHPSAAIEGVLVTPMRSAGCELLVSVIDDAVWGPALTVGLGGIWTEALRDIAVRVLPVNREEISAMLEELRGAPLLRGSRGQVGADLATLSAVIERITRLALALSPRLALLEINPLRVHAQEVEVLDALLVWHD